MQKSTSNRACYSIKCPILLTLKLTFMLILAGSITVSGSVYSQETLVSLHVRQATISEVIKMIQKQTPYKFVYNNNVFPAHTQLDVTVTDQTVAAVLNRILMNTGFTYKMLSDNLIVLTSINPLSEDLKVSGIVVDEAGNPLPGITVRSRADRFSSTATDQNGHFYISLKNNEDVLIFSYMGFATQEITVHTNSQVKVVLRQAAGTLDEVQVIGYGTATKRTNTGAVSSITAAALGRQTVDNPLTALQGHIAGMQITQDNGLPGAGVRVNIRGAYSGLSSAGYIPLYVIDGVPFTLFNGGVPASDNLNAYGASGANGGISPFSMINPDDIERIDVLKDADATAIYGSRGSNGVILITTKKGSTGKTMVNVNVNHGISDVAHFIPMMNTPEYLGMRSNAFADAGIVPSAANALDLTTWNQQAYTDWQKWAIGKTAQTTNATASVSGGNAQNTFLFSSTYRRQGTVYRGNYDASTFSNRLNAGHQSRDGKFSIDLSVNYTYMKTFLPSEDLSSLYDLAPNYPLYNADGSQNWTSTNPLSYLSQNTTAQTTNLITNLHLAYKILPELSLKANAGYTLTSLKQSQVNPASAQNPAGNRTSTLSYADNDNNNYILEPQLEYNKKVGKGTFQALAGTTFQQSKSTGINLTGSGYSNEALIYSLLSAASVTTSYNNNSTYKYTAFFGRLNFNWDQKYILDGTFRRDGSSRFGPDHRFGSFGALGASWIFTEERWMKELDFLSFGKLRASYGITGNDQIPDYQYYALNSVAGSRYSYGGSTVTYPSNIANPDLHWESTRKLDIALELGFLKDRITLKTDYYRNRTSDLLNYITLPGQSGTSGYLGNLDASVQNKGWEFELNTLNMAGRNFRWSTAVNLTISRNKLLAFDNLAKSSYSNSYIIGKPTDIVMLYHYTGVDVNTGLPTFQDKNGDGIINYSGDRFVAPYGNPYYAGISNTLTYADFSLDFTFQYNHRNGYLNSPLNTNYSPYGYNYTNQTTAVLDRWIQAGNAAFYPKASVNYDSSYGNMPGSDSNWGDASYLKLKTVSLNYALPKAWIRRIKMSNASVYLQGQNLYTWAKQKYTYDPETTAPGTGQGLGTGRYIALPQLRTFVLGLNCSL